MKTYLLQYSFLSFKTALELLASTHVILGRVNIRPLTIEFAAARLHCLCFQLAWARKQAVHGGVASFRQNIGGITDYRLFFQCVRLSAVMLY